MLDLDDLDTLTVSRQRAFQTCPRKERLRYVEQLVPISTARVMFFGRMMHDGLEAWFIAHKDGRADVALDDALAEIQTSHSRGEENLFELMRAEELMRAYDARWRDVEMVVLEVEREFGLPLINPASAAPSRTWALRGKIDALIEVVEHGIAKRYLVEHKTSSDDISPGSPYWTHLRIDAQISTYYDGCTSLGYQIDGCLYDVIGKPALKPYRATPDKDQKWTKGKLCKLCKEKGLAPIVDDQGKPSGEMTDGKTQWFSAGCKVCSGSGYEIAPALYSKQRLRDETSEEFRLRVRAALCERPDHFLQRGVVVRLEDELDEHRTEQWSTAKMMREFQKLGIYPKHPQSCQQFNRFCDYHPLCVGDVQADDRGIYEIQRPHSELSIPSPEERKTA